MSRKSLKKIGKKTLMQATMRKMVKDKSAGVTVPIRMPAEMRDRLWNAAKATYPHSSIAKIVRSAVDEYFGAGVSPTEHLSLKTLKEDDRARVRRYVKFLEEADPDLKALSDLHTQRLFRLNPRLK
jgi:predicted DNA-binding protein